MDRLQEEAEMSPEGCCCGKGKLHPGVKDFIVKVGDEIIVIKAVPALVCDVCKEAYFTPDISRKIDEVMKDYYAGKLRTRPLKAGEVELEQDA
jgi:YgiT-type zinc finger domain-containing protein